MFGVLSIGLLMRSKIIPASLDGGVKGNDLIASSLPLSGLRFNKKEY